MVFFLLVGCGFFVVVVVGFFWLLFWFFSVFWFWVFFSAMENFPGERISFGETLNVFLWCEIGLSAWDARLFPASL